MSVVRFEGPSGGHDGRAVPAKVPSPKKPKREKPKAVIGTADKTVQ